MREQVSIVLQCLDKRVGMAKPNDAVSLLLLETGRKLGAAAKVHLYGFLEGAVLAKAHLVCNQLTAVTAATIK